MSQIQLLFPLLAKLQAQKIITGLVIIGLLLNSNLMGNIKKSLSTSHGRMLLFLIIWMVMSVPFGIYPGHSFMFLTASFWKVLVMVFLVLAFTSSKEELNKLIWTYILAVGLLSVLTVMGSSISRLAINEAVYDANDTALQFLLAIPFVFWKFKSSDGAKKILAGIIFLVLLVAMVKTNSRGGFLGLVVVTAVIVLQIRSYEKHGLMKAVLTLFFLGGVVFYSADVAYIERISTITNPSEDYNITSTTGRIQIWGRGIEMMLRNPLFGIGVANFINADGMLYSDIGARWNAAHNSFVEIGSELGMPGLFAFCFLIWSTIKKTRNIVSANGNVDSNNLQRITAYSIVGSWIGFIVTGSFLSAAYTTSFYFLLALSFAFIRLESLTENNNPPKDVPG